MQTSMLLVRLSPIVIIFSFTSCGEILIFISQNKTKICFSAGDWQKNLVLQPSAFQPHLFELRGALLTDYIGTKPFGMLQERLE
jgi:hypothetical protein